MTMNESWVYRNGVPVSPQKAFEIDNNYIDGQPSKGTTSKMATNNQQTHSVAEDFEDSERYFWWNMVRILLIAVVIIIVAIMVNNTISNVISGGEWIPLKNCTATTVAQGHQNYTCWMPLPK
jgi:hypothetical protein